MSEAAAPAGRKITFLIQDGTGHTTLELDPAAAAGKFAELRRDGKALFDVTLLDEENLVVDAGTDGAALPERLLVVPAYQGG
ncbi:MAG TPA: hypothetical protein VD861_11000 [Pyrinomonadaceae bacterium]|nr:hypothetical protein [Pyrinomonadaceae bacterium]